MMSRMRDMLAEGLLLALPLGAAAYLLHKVFGILMKVVSPVAGLVPHGHWFGTVAVEVAAAIVLLLALLALGVFAKSRFGRRVAGTIERVVLSKIPFYLIFKNIAADLTNVESDTDLRPALVPVDGDAGLGFLVGGSAGAAMFTAFLPSAPGAATGSVVMVPHARVQLLDVQTGGAMRTMKQRGLGLQALARAQPTNVASASSDDVTPAQRRTA